jgi:aminoglycoside phosphotransferase (APT) family kinase protein
MYALTAQERQAYGSTDNMALLHEAVSEVVGSDITLEQHETQGLTTLVFSCATPEADFIVRRGKNENAFRKDAFIGDHFTHEALPVPHVTGISRLEDGSVVCISERASGAPADEAVLYYPGSELNTSLMHTLQAMHSTQGNEVDETLFVSPKRRLATVMYDKADANVSRKLDVATREEIAFIQQRVGRYAMPDLRRLCHNDVKGDNLIAFEGKITGVIDWAMADFGDPASDLSRLYASYPEAVNFNEYDLRGEAADHLRERVLYYAMAACVGSARFFSGLHDYTRIADAENRLVELANEAASIQ